MNQTPKPRPYAVIATSDCVACGCCEKICPRQAIAVSKGIFAVVTAQRCIGCGLCVKACPASIIHLEVSA